MTALKKVITQDGEPVVHFDLDAIEAEAVEEPFVFRLGGEVFQMAAPEDADWQVTDQMSETNAGLRSFVRDLLGDEDYERFAKHRLSNKQITALLDACNKHYGTSPGKSAASGRS
ncbi:hypothetical protein, partial [Streptosporangium sp. NPDC049644]